MDELQTRRSHLTKELAKAEQSLKKVIEEYRLIEIELKKIDTEKEEEKEKEKEKKIDIPPKLRSRKDYLKDFDRRSLIIRKKSIESESESESERESESESEEEEKECSICGDPDGCSKCPGCHDYCCIICFVNCQKCDDDGMDDFQFCPDCFSICLGCDDLICNTCLGAGIKCKKCNCDLCSDCVIHKKDCKNCLAKVNREANREAAKKRKREEDEEEENRSTKIRKIDNKNAE